MTNSFFCSDSVVSEFQTLRDFLRFAVSRFNAEKLVFGHGSASAYDEAAYLILHSLNLPHDSLEVFLDARLTHDEKIKLAMLFNRRIKERQPAAYLTGEAWLSGYRFRSDPRAIVPRSFIAELLGEQLLPWIDYPNKISHILDLCTGSGCLAILAAFAFPQAKIDAIDLSSDALTLAQGNIADYELESQIELLQSDLFSALTHRRYDLIISNPPYVNAQAMAMLPAEYRAEPSMALAGGEDGLDLVRRILSDANRYLESNGLLVVEIGHNREVIEANFPNLPFTWLETSAGSDYVFLLSSEALIGLG